MDVSKIYLYISLLIYDLQSEDWINAYYMLKGFLKARRPPKVSNEMKYTNEKMTWNTQDTNLSRYVPKANVDHTLSGQGTAISTLNHSATTPNIFMFAIIFECGNSHYFYCPTCWSQWTLIWFIHQSDKHTNKTRSDTVFINS